MNTSAERARFLTPALFGWLAILILAIGLVAWSVPMLLQQRQRRQQLSLLLAADAKESAQIGQLDAWQEAADEAIAQARADRNVLLSMYGACRSPEDFFVVHPEHFVSVNRPKYNGFSLLVYVPAGQFRITADVTAEPPDGQPDERSPLTLEPVHREFTLQGGRAYQMDVEFDSSNETQSSLRITLTDCEPEVVHLEPVDQQGSRRKGNNNLLRATHYLTGSSIVSQHDLIDDAFWVVRRSDKQTAWLRLRIALRGTGPARLPANDRLLLRRQTEQTASAPSSTPIDRLEFRDGWYYEQPSQVPAD